MIVLRQGKFRGIEYRGDFRHPLEEFRGIPFALSTAGEGRFGPPLPINTTSEETFDASSHGYRCYFGAPDSKDLKTQDEDCLNANIMRPKKRPAGLRLPILVHIYGGAFNFGSGPSRHVANFVGWSAEPFIGITFNYRVGALGFLPSGLTQKAGLLNAGLKDQDMLLRWVRDNALDFGGDPDDVTLMGNSAGAHSVRSPEKISMLYVSSHSIDLY